MDVVMKQWSAEDDGYLDQTTTDALRRQPRYTDKPNGNCIESSDAAAAESPLTRRIPVTPTIPSHHHLYWQAAGARRHSNAGSPTIVDC